MADIICIAGPTASGKTALAVELAKALGGQVISCDSMQVYRHMDIGTAKPTPAEMQGIPHYMLDVAEPEEHFFLRVTGDSMINAGIRDGDLVLLRRQDTAENGQIVACLVDGEDATLKRFRRQRDMVLLQPENPAYEPKLIPLSDFETGAARIVGVAVRLVREL